MGRSGWQGETQQKVCDLVDALLTWADRKLEDGAEPPCAIEFEWVVQSDSRSWLRVRTTDEELNQLFILFCEQERGKETESVKRNFTYLLEKLEDIKLLDPINDGTHNLPRVPGKLFYLKLPSKNRFTNLKHVRSLVAAQGSSTQGQPVSDIEAQVQQIRHQLYERIYQEYGRIRVFGISEPVDVADIYAGTDVWREIVNRRWRSLFELLQSPAAAEHLDRLGLEGQEPLRYSGWDLAVNLQRLMVLGKPGIGKTTYLQYLMVQCMEGRFEPDKLPIFVQLSQFARAVQPDASGNGLLSFICSTLSQCGVSEESVQAILEAGKALICLDGLDEVPAVSEELVASQIDQFIDRYAGNSFLITCRVAANKSKFSRQNFTEIEVADFSREQAEFFIRLWFRALSKSHPQPEHRLAEDLIELLAQPKHRAIRELAVTPLLLNLVCIVFRDMRDLPRSHHQLYEQGIDALLEKWDLYRNVQRDEIYRNLGKANKIELLSQLARVSFDRSDFFFGEQLTQTVVSQYLREANLAPASPTQLQVDSQAIVQAIAAHHGLLAERATGIYSFSHLTFHEYFVARWIHLEQAWQILLPQICNPQWREVFLLVAEMQFPGDDLICRMMQQIQESFAPDAKLQRLLGWTNGMAIKAAESLPYKHSALRAWYLCSIGCNFDEGVESFRKSGQATADYHAFSLSRSMGLDEALANDISELNFLYRRICDALSLVAEEKVATDLMVALLYLYKKHLIDGLLSVILPIKVLLLQLDNFTSPSQQDLFLRWWQQNGQEWALHVLERHRSLKNETNERLNQILQQMDEAQKSTLKRYYDANLLLLDCIKRAESLSPSVQETIKTTLLLPSAMTISNN